jgi:ABC-type antimicrobial peptide transport system permease subunit
LPELEWLGVDDSSDTRPTGLVSVADGVDVQSFIERLPAELGPATTAVEPPVELARLRQVQGFPWALAVFLGVIGFVALIHALVTSVGLHRKEVAVLRTLGMTPLGATEAMFTAVLVFAIIGALVGVPLGVFVGRAVWHGLAGSLGVVIATRIPWLHVVGVALVGTILLALLALLPVRTVVRAQPASALRAE